MRLASVSVDLDPIELLLTASTRSAPRRAGGLTDVIIRRSVPRYSLFARHGVRATFFVVARISPRHGRGRGRAGAGARDGPAGHEVGNHSFRPSLRPRAPAPRASLPRRSAAPTARSPPRRVPLFGFRAPGYDVSRRCSTRSRGSATSYDSVDLSGAGYYAASGGHGRAARRRTKERRGAEPTPGRCSLRRIPPDRRRRRRAARPATGGAAPSPFTPCCASRRSAPPPARAAALRSFWLEQMRARPFFNFELHGTTCATPISTASRRSWWPGSRICGRRSPPSAARWPRRWIDCRRRCGS